ncbi:MAG: hypothetical protein OEY44_00025 [Candidatus Peregrinibacteria bacterium]|nr:hypothetical protein [Candidatus Peregrinibacteria bacterium]
MEQDWFSYDREGQVVTIRVAGKKELKIRLADCEISHFSGGPGGQNVNRHMNGVRLIYRMPEEYVLFHKKTRELIARSMNERSQEQNLRAAFETMAEKLRQYFYVPELRKKTRVPKGSKKKRLENKKLRGRVKEGRKKVDFSE